MGRAIFHKKYLKIPVLAQPVCLGRKVTVDDIAFLVLETPRGDNHNIAFPYPGSLFDLTFDPTHTGDTIITPDTDMIGSHHKICECELLTSPFLGKTNPDNWRSIRIYCVWIYIIVIIGSNSDNSFVTCMTLRPMKVCIVYMVALRSHKTYPHHFLPTHSFPYILPFSFSTRQ